MSHEGGASGGFSASLRVARAPFLLLPVTLVAVGTGAAVHLGAEDWGYAALALLGLLAAHVAVNAFNEASDFRTGIDLRTKRTPFSGGSGTLPEGLLSPGAAVAIAVAASAVAAAVALFFFAVVGWRLAPIFLLGAVAVFTYTGFLARNYIGELFAGLGLGALPVLGTTLVQTGNYEPLAMAASLPAFLMTFNLLLLNEFPDEIADREGGRRNLILLLGRKRAARLYFLFCALVPISLIVFVARAALPPLALVATIPSLALMPALSWALSAAEQPVPDRALGSNVVWNLSTNLVLAFALAF